MSQIVLFTIAAYVLEIGRRFKVKALEGALNEIVRRHEVLRTRYEERDGVPEQVIEEVKI